jgi:hypothetical protein
MLAFAFFSGWGIVCISNVPVFRHKAALRGRDELWRTSQYPAILGILQKGV